MNHFILTVPYRRGEFPSGGGGGGRVPTNVERELISVQRSDVADEVTQERIRRPHTPDLIAPPPPHV